MSRQPLGVGRGCTLVVLFAACHAGPSVPPAPPAIDLRPAFVALDLPPRAQQARPTCSIFAVIAAIEFAVARIHGRGERLSVEYCNWAANAATGRNDDGDFFHCALQGFETFGLCRDERWPYAAAFDPTAMPSPPALVDAGRLLGRCGERLRLRWLRPNDGRPGLDDAQFGAVLAALADGWPVAAGAAHSRLLVGYRGDPRAPGGGVFATIDSATGAFGEVSAQFVRDDVCDAVVVTADRAVDPPR